LHRTGIDPETLRDLAHAGPSRSRQSLPDPLFQLGGYPRPPEPFSFALGPRQASTDSFLDHGALELGKHAHHLKHRLTGRRSGVEPLLMQEQVDAKGMQLRQEGDQVLQAAAEPIDRPGQGKAGLCGARREIYRSRTAAFT
jgi:hypothetical protein